MERANQWLDAIGLSEDGLACADPLVAVYEQGLAGRIGGAAALRLTLNDLKLSGNYFNSSVTLTRSDINPVHSVCRQRRGSGDRGCRNFGVA